MRGAGGSFGIATNIRVRTYAEPPSVTVFQYNWTLTAKDALDAFVAFQDFARTDVPSKLGVKLDFRPGPNPGTVTCSLRGGWYGDNGQFDDVISPFLNKMPAVTDQRVSPGTYSDSIKFFGRREQILPINPGPPGSFYVKSLMTPEDAPLSDSAMKAFVDTLAGHPNTHPSIVSISLCVFRLVLLIDRHRVGSLKSNLLGGATLSSTRCPCLIHHTRIGILCLLSKLTWKQKSLMSRTHKLDLTSRTVCWKAILQMFHVDILRRCQVLWAVLRRTCRMIGITGAFVYSTSTFNIC